MKAIQTALVIIALIGSSIVATSADAQRRGGGGGGGHRGGHGHGHHGHGHHGHGHGHSHFSAFFAFPGPFFYGPGYYPGYYYPNYYYPRYSYPYPSAAGETSAPVYIEQPAPTAAPAAAPSESGGAFWYFCRDTRTYYPYVEQCASPWERVTPSRTPPT
jgi:hypothetical protein